MAARKPIKWGAAREKKKATTKALQETSNRAMVIRDLSEKCLNGSITRKEGNLLLMALEREKLAQGSCFSANGDSMIRWLRKTTNLQSRVNKKPKRF